MSRDHMHQDQVDIDASVARRLLAEQMPELAGMPVHRVSSGGTENAVFRLGEELTLRMPLQASAVGGLMKEMRWLPVISPYISLEVPEVLATGRPSDLYPFPWALMRWVPGEDAMTGRIRSMRQAAIAVAGFISELRSIDMADSPPPGRRGSSAACR